MRSLTDEFTTIQRHPNANIYNEFLDEQPCPVCNNPTRIPVTHDCVIVKLKSPFRVTDSSYRTPSKSGVAPRGCCGFLCRPSSSQT
jgi:hypothetical protein